MSSRGHIIGKIVDDLAGLKYQVLTRNKLKQYDLTTTCENFFKQVLNTVYDLGLSNLNSEKSNTPGIDLGDKTKRIAYQITSTKYSPKVKATLEAITDQQKAEYDTFKIFIIGEKAKSYTIDDELLKEFSFSTDSDIIDFDTLLRDVVIADLERLDSLFTLFQKEFRRVKIELEPVSSNGNYDSSLYNLIEEIPNRKPINAQKLEELFYDDVTDDNSTFNFMSITQLYIALSKIPRRTRELIPIIVERGCKRRYNHSNEEYGILPQTLKNYLRWNQEELDSELAILADGKLTYMGDFEVEDKNHKYVTLSGLTLNTLADWTQENNISLRQILNTMDWTILDEQQ